MGRKTIEKAITIMQKNNDALLWYNGNLRGKELMDVRDVLAKK